MAGVTLKIGFRDGGALPAIQRLAYALAHRDEILALAARGVHQAVEQNFVEGGRPAWAPLSPVTLKKRKSSGGILMVRGAAGGLLGSISEKVEGSTAFVGTNAIHAAVQNFGAAQGAFGRDRRNHPLPWGTIPARPFMIMPDEDADKIVGKIETWLIGQAGG